MLIGRENEIATLHGLMSSDESQCNYSAKGHGGVSSLK